MAQWVTVNAGGLEVYAAIEHGYSVREMIERMLHNMGWINHFKLVNKDGVALDPDAWFQLAVKDGEEYTLVYQPPTDDEQHPTAPAQSEDAR